jgi:hypothetical protein
VRRGKITECVKIAGYSVLINPKCGVLLEEMEHMLIVFLNDEAQTFV